ncbi:DUF4421 domain-containing protein [Fulvivirga maritima]|uniref:DUF4421 family protein n=1 Tax=Fulvivirga maritima TaxID=2904247 RepID=UPI001F2D71E0|nr:DUF4421 family protein [Fulvivirga maritima]UII28439.1 DUF4421 domain-containing protein [Fulvivirga maritima]
MPKTNFKTYLTIMLVLTGTIFAFGQNEDSVYNYYVKKFPNKFNMKLIGADKILSMDLISQNDRNDRVNYIPNNQGVVGLGVYVFDIGFEMALKVPDFLQRNEDQFGVTEFKDFQGNIYGRKWCFDITYQKYRGFYINNADQVFPDFDSQGIYPLRRDLGIRKVILNGIHIFDSDRYSFRAGYNQSERQLRSAGSVLLITSLNNTKIEADSSLLPIEIGDHFGEDANLVNGEFSAFSLLPGYGYTFVKKYFYFNINAAVGAGLQYQEYYLNEEYKSDFVLESKVNLRASLGYDHENFFFGATAIYDNGSMQLEDARISSATGNYKFFIGYRFNEFGFLKYSIRDTLEKIGL